MSKEDLEASLNNELWKIAAEVGTLVRNSAILSRFREMVDEFVGLCQEYGDAKQVAHDERIRNCVAIETDSRLRDEEDSPGDGYEWRHATYRTEDGPSEDSMIREVEGWLPLSKELPKDPCFWITGRKVDSEFDLPGMYTLLAFHYDYESKDEPIILSGKKPLSDQVPICVLQAEYREVVQENDRGELSEFLDISLRRVRSDLGIGSDSKTEAKRQSPCITPKEHAVAILFAEPDISPTDLADRVGVSRGTLYSPAWSVVGKTLRARPAKDKFPNKADEYGHEEDNR